MRSWSITEARASIAEVFDAALNQGPQRIERRDSACVVISEEVWKKLAAEYPSFADLVTEAPIDEAGLPRRHPARILAPQPDR